MDPDGRALVMAIYNLGITGLVITNWRHLRT
jgi:hypothetical protein